MTWSTALICTALAIAIVLWLAISLKRYLSPLAREGRAARRSRRRWRNAMGVMRSTHQRDIYREWHK